MSCSLQERQRPQATLNGTDTKSPAFNVSTSRPTSMTSPVISCPNTRPFCAVVRPRTMCWSDPQIFVDTTFRITPCSILRPRGSTSFGKLIDCTSTRPSPTYTTPLFAAMSASPCRPGRMDAGPCPPIADFGKPDSGQRSPARHEQAGTRQAGT
ncbi:hypothetical protein D3C73_980390 [compost metagenome]